MTIQLILDSRLVAIIRLDDLSAAQQIAETLIEAGVLALEFTLTNPQAATEVRKQDRDRQRGSIRGVAHHVRSHHRLLQAESHCRLPRCLYAYRNRNRLGSGRRHH
jgi:hypothetical protein